MIGDDDHLPALVHKPVVQDGHSLEVWPGTGDHHVVSYCHGEALSCHRLHQPVAHLADTIQRVSQLRQRVQDFFDASVEAINGLKATAGLVGCQPQTVSIGQ